MGEKSFWKKGRFKRQGFLLFAVALLVLAGTGTLVHFAASQPPRELNFLEPEKKNPLTWAFITRYGEGEEVLGELFPSEEQLEALAGVPVTRLFCSADKFWNLYTAGVPIDVVTSCYVDAKLRRFETSGVFLQLQDLVKTEIPDFVISPETEQWCGNLKGEMYAYPHTQTIAQPENNPYPGVILLARKDLLEKYDILREGPYTKAQVLEALKIIRKKESHITPGYLDLTTLQQMFGAAAEDESGAWTDPFFQPETLEALQYMNLLYRERLLSQKVFSMTPGTLLSDLENGSVFFAATQQAYRLARCLPQEHPIWKQYQVMEPIRSDKNNSFAFRENFTEEYASTMFVKNSTYRGAQARLFACFAVNNGAFTPEQSGALERTNLLPRALPSELSLPWAEMYSDYLQPTMPYEILFSYYSDTKLADLQERMKTYRENQIIRMVINLPQNEVADAYRVAAEQLQRDDYELVLSWRQERYRRAKEILQPPQDEAQTQPALAGRNS